MSGFFGIAAKEDCVTELFYGVDYHSHLGTKRGGMTVYGEKGFDNAIHNISNAPFRTKFELEADNMKGNIGIGVISDYEPQPLVLQSHLGSFSIATVGVINNVKELLDILYADGAVHFQEMKGGEVNATELIGALICKKSSIVEGIRYVQGLVDGSMSILVMTKDGIYAARDRMGRTPVIVGHKEGSFCVASESFAYMNLGYTDYHELGPAEIYYCTADEGKIVGEPQEEMKMCTFMWVYYGYPTASYEGVGVEEMRCNCGSVMAIRDNLQVEVDLVAGVPDSGLAYAIGYANETMIPYARPFIKYTPTWSRSFMPTNQKQRNLVAHMKLIPVYEYIKDKSLLLIDDSIVRGTQSKETAEFLYQHGAREVHMRSACPPLMHVCKYLNFSRSRSEMDLITRRTIAELEGTDKITPELIEIYSNPDSEQYKRMVKTIGDKLSFTSLDFLRLDDLIKSIGIDPSKLCTYCWNGKE